MLCRKRGPRIAREFRINDRIRAREVRLIGENGEQLGAVPLFRALEMAREAGLDLVEVAPNAVPPVCRLLDYGKFKYEQAKKEREARKHQKNVLLREIRMEPKIAEHDVDFKLRTAEKLLKEGDKVKVSVRFRGREITHPQIGRELLEQVYGRLKNIANIEKPVGMEGRQMTMILAPGAAKPERPQRPSGSSAPRPAEPAPPAPEAPAAAAPASE
ncbi:MAG TPA: translation initiation factor IF-3 [Dehalococcoidia bacterium]|nr:translation initiation factor IF-3 [Dehalococcoidia bacterium]